MGSDGKMVRKNKIRRNQLPTFNHCIKRSMARYSKVSNRWMILLIGHLLNFTFIRCKRFFKKLTWNELSAQSTRQFNTHVPWLTMVRMAMIFGKWYLGSTMSKVDIWNLYDFWQMELKKKIWKKWEKDVVRVGRNKSSKDRTWSAVPGALLGVISWRIEVRAGQRP